MDYRHQFVWSCNSNQRKKQSEAPLEMYIKKPLQGTLGGPVHLLKMWIKHAGKG